MPVLSLAEAKIHLNITTSMYDDELQDVIDAAEAAIAQRVGFLEPTPVTVRANGGGPTLLLPHLPAIELTTITPYGSTTQLDTASLYLDAEAGIVSYPTAAGSFAWPSYSVSYIAGRTEVPADLMLAVKEMTRHLWRSQRGPTTAKAADQQPGAGHLIPEFVAELIEGHEPVVGFA